ncbi:telomerase RNA component interacting RNase-like isoform X2 [Penaeus japonicus]|uniref:telomerase RNA component interacting RNase-like isoform X2 n=1 Tax=Penaeus japonicus TaxID=27405 RepID=UPI001C70D791|nr:telomerase RNA component interacting RNase-like isoform X2 [Penaeus japonicus]
MADASGQVYASSDSREDSNSEDSTKQQPGNIFRNDGSFMEMFKKLQEDQKKREDDPRPALKESSSVSGADDRASPHSSPHSSAKELPKKTSLSFVGKRRGGRILATGMVKKQRKEAESEKPDGGKTDAWSQYMNEVRKYKEQSCEEEGKRRPLVK